MATNQFRIEDERTQGAPPERRPSKMKGCLIGCLAVVVVLVLLGIVAAIWFSRNWKDLAATGITTGIKQTIDETDLPAEEKAEVMVEVNRGADLFREGRISGEQAARLMERLVQSPLFTAFVASAAEKKYIDPSGLSDEEKAQANVTLQRFARGVIDEKINQPTRDAVMGHIATKQGDSWQFRDTVSDDELRAFLTAAKTAADDADVAEQPQAIDPSDEVKRIIDEAMNQPAAVPPLEGAPANP